MRVAIAAFMLATFLARLSIAIGIFFVIARGEIAPLLVSGLFFALFIWSRPSHDETLEG